MSYMFSVNDTYVMVLLVTRNKNKMTCSFVVSIINFECELSDMKQFLESFNHLGYFFFLSFLSFFFFFIFLFFYFGFAEPL